jgi:putative addiction module component (TIGR02574 family)
MKLPDADRAALAARLLDSLPGVLSESDEGLAEALRRDAELDRDPSVGMNLDELKTELRRA